jgi:hypothetical protein
MKQIILIRTHKTSRIGHEKAPISDNSKKVVQKLPKDHYHLWKQSLEKDLQLELALQFGSMFTMYRYIVSFCEME